MSVSMTIAATLFALTAPLANPATPATTAAATVVTATGQTVRPTTRVCVRNHRVGSILASKICRRYANWLSDGIDPLATQQRAR